MILERQDFIDDFASHRIETICSKLKNRIANEPDFSITPDEAGIIIEIYKKTFQDLNLIE